MHFINDIMAVGTKIADDIRKFNNNISRACTASARRVFKGFKSELQGQTRTALGPKMEKTWQGQTYPNTGISKDASVFIFSKAPKIVLAFDRGVTIKSKDGWFLAVPTEWCPKTYMGKRVTPSNFPTDYYGRLDMVYIKSKRIGILVAEHPPGVDTRKKGGIKGGSKFTAKDIKTGKFLEKAIMFYLFPQVSLTKKLSVEPVAQKWLDNFSGYITEELNNEQG